MGGPGTMRESARPARRIRRAWPALRLVAGVAVLVLLLRRLGSAPFLAALSLVDGRGLALAVGLGGLTTVMSAWRWCRVAGGLGMRLPLGAAVGDYYGSLFLNAALPGGVMGDVHRAVRHGRGVGDVGLGVRAVVLERFAGQVVLAVVGVATVLLSPFSPITSTWLRVPAGAASPGGRPLLAVLAVLGVLTVVGAVLVRHRIRPRIRPLVRDVRRGLLSRRVGPGVLVASVLVVAGHLAVFVLAARVAGSTASVARLAPIVLLALLAMGIPLNVGGWGPREGVTAWAFAAAGMSPHQGVTVAVVYGVFAFAASLPGALVLAARRFRSEPQPEPTSDPRPDPRPELQSDPRPELGIGAVQLEAGGSPKVYLSSTMSPIWRTSARTAR